MPLINVKLIDGVFSHDQKQEIARRITDTMVEGCRSRRGARTP